MSVTAPAVRRPVRRRRLLPNQHGAWAFLALPLVLGAVLAGWSDLLLPLAVAWIASYPFSWAVAALVSLPHPERYRAAAVLWGTLAGASGLVVLAQRPWLVWAMLLYGAAFAVNLGFARARAERAVANDLLLVGECSFLVPVVAGVVAGQTGWSPPGSVLTDPLALAWTLFCALTLIGSTLHVKSLIRERRDPRYTSASRWFALACVPVATGVALVCGVPWWAVAVPFSLLAGRALWLHDPTMPPSHLGMVELGCFLVVAAGAVAARAVG